MGIKALYAGSFDPVTNGHLDIIKRAATIFDHLVIAIGNNPKKPGLFTVDERIELLRGSCKAIKNVSVSTYTGLTAEFAAKNKVKVLVRGVRDGQDYIAETQMAHMNFHLRQGIETVFLPCHQKLTDVSSSLIKEVASMGGDISEFVPKIVERALLKKFSR